MSERPKSMSMIFPGFYMPCRCWTFTFLLSGFYCAGDLGGRGEWNGTITCV